MTIDIFIPCLIDQFYPQTAFNMVKILEKLGHEVHYNTNQTCCGQTAFKNGFWDDAKILGKKFINDFPNNRLVVGPSASCVGMVRKHYHELFHNTSMHIEFRQLQKNLFEFTEFLVKELKVTDLGATFEAKVTYHDSCSALRIIGIKEEPRTLLQNVKGLELIEMKDTDTCCGFGHSFSLKNEAISTAMAEQKIQNAVDTEAEYIVSTDYSCLMHQEAYIKKHKLPIKTMHLIDVLASGL
jgi:L-lactate dehydrogenase complex protein LldE